MQDAAALQSALLQAVQSNVYRGFEAIKKAAKIRAATTNLVGPGIFAGTGRSDFIFNYFLCRNVF